MLFSPLFNTKKDTFVLQLVFFQQKADRLHHYPWLITGIVFFFGCFKTSEYTQNITTRLFPVKRFDSFAFEGNFFLGLKNYGTMRSEPNQRFVKETCGQWIMKTHKKMLQEKIYYLCMISRGR